MTNFQAPLSGTHSFSRNVDDFHFQLNVVNGDFLSVQQICEKKNEGFLIFQNTFES